MVALSQSGWYGGLKAVWRREMGASFDYENGLVARKTRMKNCIVFILSIFLLLTFGCAPKVRTVYLKNTFDNEAANAALQPGPNRIVGNAFLTLQNGGVMTCAGKKIVLIPDTAYSREVLLDLYSNINSGYRDVKSLERTVYVPWDKEYERLRTTSYCDAMGNFEFDQLSDGDYFIITSIIWPGPFELEGGGLLERVSVSGGESKRVVISR